MEAEQALVNGNLIKKHIGKSVRMYLKVENVSSGGRQVNVVNLWNLSFEIREIKNNFIVIDCLTGSCFQVQGLTTDKKTIAIKLDQPLNQPLSGYIEIFGTALNQETINCSEVRQILMISRKKVSFSKIFLLFRSSCFQMMKIPNLSMKNLTTRSSKPWTTWGIFTSLARINCSILNFHLKTQELNTFFFDFKLFLYLIFIG